MEHGSDFELRTEPRWSLHLDPCDTKNGSAAISKLEQRKLETFNFCGAMCVPLKYTENGGSIILLSPEPALNQ